ncbi:MAG TPA: hypothetical protein VFV38_44175 [Ktedonobacteraceae bacterium]|nr:hypothetical protein [Ktedonobacteraceae bacterium]
MSNQRVMTIYIHPLDGGPMKQVRVDLMQIELLAIKTPDDSQRNEIRIRELARQIKEQCQGQIYPERNRDQLAALLRGFSHYQRFNGVVLDMPGTIAPEAESNGQNTGTSEAVKQELARITRQVEQLSRDLRAEREAHEFSRAQLVMLKNNYKNIRLLYDKNNTQLAEVQQRAQQAHQDAEHWRKTAEHLTAYAQDAQQEVGKFEVQLERTHHKLQALQTTFQEEQQAWASKEQELSQLRQRQIEAESALKHLEEALKKREQELADLRLQLFDDLPATSTSPEEAIWKNL